MDLVNVVGKWDPSRTLHSVQDQVTGVRVGVQAENQSRHITTITGEL